MSRGGLDRDNNVAVIICGIEQALTEISPSAAASRGRAPTEGDCMIVFCGVSMPEKESIPES